MGLRRATHCLFSIENHDFRKIPYSYSLDTDHPIIKIFLVEFAVRLLPDTQRMDIIST